MEVTHRSHQAAQLCNRRAVILLLIINARWRCCAKDKACGRSISSRSAYLDAVSLFSHAIQPTLRPRAAAALPEPCSSYCCLIAPSAPNCAPARGRLQRLESEGDQSGFPLSGWPGATREPYFWHRIRPYIYPQNKGFV